MRQIPKKNYVILILMIIGVVVVTCLGARIYNNTIKTSSILYKYLKTIKGDELNLYLNENPSTVIYISDRYDVSKEGLEEKLKDRIIELNLYENFIYLDKEQLTPSFIADFNKQNETSITISKLLTLIVFNDNEVEIIYYSLKEEDVKTIDFEGVRWLT